MIKHISLDLWNTLLVSNNKFSIDRINYFHNNYFINHDKSLINEKIETVGEKADMINMNKGISLESEKMYNELLSQENIIVDNIELSKIYNDLEIKFLNNIPELMYDFNKITDYKKNFHKLENLILKQ